MVETEYREAAVRARNRELIHSFFTTRVAPRFLEPAKNSTYQPPPPPPPPPQPEPPPPPPPPLLDPGAAEEEEMAPEKDPLSELTNPFAPNEFHAFPEYHDGEYADAPWPPA